MRKRKPKKGKGGEKLVAIELSFAPFDRTVLKLRYLKRTKD